MYISHDEEAAWHAFSKYFSAKKSDLDVFPGIAKEWNHWKNVWNFATTNQVPVQDESDEYRRMIRYASDTISQLWELFHNGDNDYNHMYDLAVQFDQRFQNMSEKILNRLDLLDSEKVNNRE